MIVLGVLIQLMFYSYVLMGIYFVIFTIILILFYFKTVKSEPELEEFLPERFRKEMDIKIS